MTLQFVEDFINSHNNGRYFHISYKSSIKPSANHKDKVIEKITHNKVVRLVPYSSISNNVVMGYSNPNETTILKNYIKHNANTNSILVMFASTNNRYHKGDVNYYVNGVLTSKSDVMALCPASAFNHTNNAPVFSVKLENIIELR